MATSETETKKEKGGWLPADVKHHHVVFAMQIVMSLSVSIYCMVEAANGEKTEVFLPILAGVLGYWLPSPNSNRDLRANVEATRSKMDEFFKVRADDRQKRKVLKKELAAALAAGPRLGPGVVEMV